MAPTRFSSGPAPPNLPFPSLGAEPHQQVLHRHQLVQHGLHGRRPRSSHNSDATAPLSPWPTEQGRRATSGARRKRDRPPLRKSQSLPVAVAEPASCRRRGAHLGLVMRMLQQAPLPPHGPQAAHSAWLVLKLVFLGTLQVPLSTEAASVKYETMS